MMKEQKYKKKKDESELRNVYFSIQKQRVVAQEERKMNLLKRQLKGGYDDNVSIISSASKKKKTVSPDFNKSPALYKPRRI